MWSSHQTLTWQYVTCGSAQARDTHPQACSSQAGAHIVIRHPTGGSNSLPAQIATGPSGHTENETAPLRASAQAGTAMPGLLPLVFVLACLVPMWITARQRPRQNGFLGRRVDSGSRPGISPRLVHHYRRDATVPPSSHPRATSRSPSDTPPCPEHGHPGVRDCERRARRGLPAPRLLRSSYRREHSWSRDPRRRDAAELAKSVKPLLRWKSPCNFA
jgi:hypothetical protein